MPTKYDIGEIREFTTKEGADYTVQRTDRMVPGMEYYWRVPCDNAKGYVGGYAEGSREAGGAARAAIRAFDITGTRPERRIAKILEG